MRRLCKEKGTHNELRSLGKSFDSLVNSSLPLARSCEPFEGCSDMVAVKWRKSRETTPFIRAGSFSFSQFRDDDDKTLSLDDDDDDDEKERETSRFAFKIRKIRE